MERIGEGIGLSQQGDAASARRVFDEVWTLVGPDGDAFHRLAVAHAMADVQDALVDELAWDERALAAADELTQDRLRAAGMDRSVGSLYPSLHLNLGDVHRRLGNTEQAKVHLRLGRAALVELPTDGYGELVRAGLDQLAERIGELPQGGPGAGPP